MAQLNEAEHWPEIGEQNITSIQEHLNMTFRW